MVKNDQIDQTLPFWPVSFDFFRNGTLQRAEVFCVEFSASKLLF